MVKLHVVLFYAFQVNQVDGSYMEHQMYSLIHPKMNFRGHSFFGWCLEYGGTPAPTADLSRRA